MVSTTLPHVCISQVKAAVKRVTGRRFPKQVQRINRDRNEVEAVAAP